ncbi:MAG: hypothetical protein V4696_12875 [Pseudomonadota bacterium]
MNLESILQILRTAADATTAFRQLFDQAVETFSESDQATLKAAYAEARIASDAVHARLQDKLDAASER